ncbi:MAG: tetratricopeptide repeat protein [Armatimonadota bacterium]|nr:tetratricopeptide repeat protein [bacterium]
MEKNLTHSKPKLALAVFTSPGAAFEEIVDRGLLGTGFLLVLLTGIVSVVSVLVRAVNSEPLQFFALGKENPITWVGLWLLYGLGLHYLLKWLNTEADYRKILTILGWGHISLLISQVLMIFSVIGMSQAHPNLMLLNTVGTVVVAAQVWYVIAVGFGLQTVFRVPIGRAIMSYIAVAAAATIGLTITYGSSRMKLFQNASPGIATAAQRIIAVDQIPWLAAAAIGLAFGLWKLGESLGWDTRQRTNRAVIAGIIGIALFGAYTYTWTKVDYYGSLITTKRMFDRSEPEAAGRLEKLLSLSQDKRYQAEIMLDIADVYYLTDKPELSIKHYKDFLDLVKQSNVDGEDSQAIARAHSGIGAVYDSQGKYDAAISEFKKSADAWPQFRDPWVRLAVTYDRMGDYKKAIDAGNHAIKKMDSDAVTAWVALAQAFTQTGDKKQAEAAIKMVIGTDDALAKRISKGPGGWNAAVDKLTRDDLKFPLEKNPVKETRGKRK